MKILGMLLLFLSMPVMATSLTGKVREVIDGDTIKVSINDCKYKVLCENIEVRFAGIDAPEIKGKCDKEKNLALQAKALVEYNYMQDDTVYLENAKRDKYFRLLSRQDVIATRLLQSGLAVKYNGHGEKNDWCK
jgi:micrococcal nuclease